MALGYCWNTAAIHFDVPSAEITLYEIHLQELITIWLWLQTTNTTSAVLWHCTHPLSTLYLCWPPFSVSHPIITVYATDILQNFTMKSACDNDLDFTARSVWFMLSWVVRKPSNLLEDGGLFMECCRHNLSWWKLQGIMLTYFKSSKVKIIAACSNTLETRISIFNGVFRGFISHENQQIASLSQT